ncbi:MAG: hypothetical protein IJA97_02220 [Clostridia bacterium]|nr:hypothetical protein [Clostridia bacterium]
MVQISAKLIKNHKTVKSVTYKNVSEYESKDFYFHLSEISRRLDIETPIVINHHRENYEQFNFVKFKPDDFIDKVSFDELLLENIDT